MAKSVGLSRKLKLQWLNKTAELVMQGLSSDEIHAQLNEYLSYEISSPTVLRKSREILMAIWVYDNGVNIRLREEALNILKDSYEQSLPVHWCMMLATYPIFVDLNRLIGKMTEFQDEITLGQIRQKLYDEWGERSTLCHTLDKNIATLKELNALQSDRPGKYEVVKHPVVNNRIVSFMIYTTMLIDNNGYYLLSNICDAPYFYPFEYKVEKELLLTDRRFSINHFGSDLSVTLSDVGGAGSSVSPQI